MAADSKLAADRDADADNLPASGKPDITQQGKALDAIDLLTPVDLIKKSSANRVKQKHVEAQGPQHIAAQAASPEPLKTAPAGKKVATRGRNANLQVVEVEPQAKPGKRKAVSENADKLAPGIPAEQSDEAIFLPNKKRSKSGKSASQKAADAASLDSSLALPHQLEAAGASALREVPGLPGVKHQMPELASAIDDANDAKPALASAKAAASESTSQSGPARSSNSRRQALSGKAAAGKAAVTAEAARAESVPAEAAAAEAVDKPADRSVAVALQPTLASAGAAQGVQFLKLQVS